jgi:hypothetical protein
MCLPQSGVISEESLRMIECSVMQSGKIERFSLAGKRSFCYHFLMPFLSVSLFDLAFCLPACVLDERGA